MMFLLSATLGFYTSANTWKNCESPSFTMISKYSSTDSVLIESRVSKTSERENGAIVRDGVSNFIVFPLVVLETPTEGSPSI
jgi:hypothetical protein